MSTDTHRADQLRSTGIVEIDTAIRLLDQLAGRGITDDDLEPVVEYFIGALHHSADPDRSVNAFVAWFLALPTPRAYLNLMQSRPECLQTLCLLTGCSNYLADLLIRNPEYFEIVSEIHLHTAARTFVHYSRQLNILMNACHNLDRKPDSLRRWKAREMLRIGLRDLVGIAPMPVTAKEFSYLADASVQGALNIAMETMPLAAGVAPLPFAVIGMGKLGGLELNYSSDIDLIFVHGDDLPYTVEMTDGRKIESIVYLSRIAEKLIRILSDESAEGQVFRVDMRLRPEGRFGPITRSLGSCSTYYKSWGETWEFQALIKARFIAGDRATGNRFIADLQPLVYRNQMSGQSQRDIRANKRRIEEKCALESETETNVKTGIGGIRDVEFTVQSLQFLNGFREPRLRVRGSLEAIRRLARAHLLLPEEAQIMEDGYIFLRNVEHRLQLLNGFQVQNMPSVDQAEERRRLARRLGYTDRRPFENDLARYRTAINQIMQRHFYDATPEVSGSTTPYGKRWPDLEALLDNTSSPPAIDRLKSLLTNAGFQDMDAAVHALKLPMIGNEFGEMPPDTPVAFKRIAAELLDRASRSANPDHALSGIEQVALAVPNRAQLYATFYDSRDVMDRLIRLGAGSPHLLTRLANHLQWLETLLSPEDSDDIDTDLPHGDGAVAAAEIEMLTQNLLTEMVARRRRASNPELQIDAISAVFQREALLIGAQEIWEDTDSRSAMRRLSALADATLQALLEVGIENILASHAAPQEAERVLRSVAIVGMGKLGGVELGYASDWDLLVTYDSNPRIAPEMSDSQRGGLAEQLVKSIMDAGQQLITRGAHIEIDLRLRPWGRAGAIALSLRGYAEYYRTAAETWERQAALKARFVAGDRRIGSRFLKLLQAVSSGRGITPQEEFEVVAMKKRIETERLKPGSKTTDLKLGHGGLSDIEWLAQLFQLKYGPVDKSLRSCHTLSAIVAIGAKGFLDNAEVELLLHAYNLLHRMRNTLWLQLGRSQDEMPDDSRLAGTIARQLGYQATSEIAAQDLMRADVLQLMSEVRSIFNRRFYDIPVG